MQIILFFIAGIFQIFFKEEEKVFIEEKEK